MNEVKMREIIGKTGIRLSLYTGRIENGFEDRWSSEYFYRAHNGDYVEFVSEELVDEYEFMVAEYSLNVNEELIYSYCYEPEENWTTYCHNMTPTSYSSEKYKINKECYIRVNIRRKNCVKADSQCWETLERYLAPVQLVSRVNSKFVTSEEHFREEIEDTVSKVSRLNGKKFIILTDSHYAVNGTWEHTIANIREVASRISLDGIIHLGDFTDGLASKEVNTSYVKLQYCDLLNLRLPLYVTLGNHDSNYFHNNPDTFTEEEQRKLYLAPIGKDFGRLYYYCDDAINKIRMIFLHSHDYREEDRYGYSDEELQWFKETLNSTPNEYKVLVMSHVPPLAKFHFWSNIIRNDEEMMDALVMFNESRQGKAVLAWVHGHNHCDAICNECGINIVSLGCNKCEWFEDKKPCGTTTFHRKLGTVTEDLWDVMVIEESGKVSFVRFGAGDDKEL